MTELENLNPNVYRKCDERKITHADEDDDVVDPFDDREIFGKSKFKAKHLFFMLKFIVRF